MAVSFVFTAVALLLSQMPVLPDTLVMASLLALCLHTLLGEASVMALVPALVQGIVPERCVGYGLAVLYLAHLPLMTRGCALAWAGFFGAAGLAAYGVLPGAMATGAAACALALLAYRVFLTALTYAATAKLTVAFPLLPHLFPSYSFSRAKFFRADSPPEEVAARREAAFERMDKHWAAKWPKSGAISGKLRACFSDLRFAAGNRVFLPFAKILDQWCDPCTVVENVDRMNITDSDGHVSMDIAGSYGVNVVGYERYKEFIAEGWEKTKNVGCMLGPVHPLLLENIDMLKSISGKEEVR